MSKPPSAELAPNQIDEDSLPPYQTLDEILRLHIEHTMDADDIVQAETISSAVDDTAYFFDFSSSFSKGDAVALTFEAASHGSNSYVVGCMAVEYDTTT